MTSSQTAAAPATRRTAPAPTDTGAPTCDSNPCPGSQFSGSQFSGSQFSGSQFSGSQLLESQRSDPSLSVSSPSGSWLLRRLQAGIVLYQRAREGRPSPCRFFPSCSAYALEALEVHGTRRGGWLSVRRLIRCRPLGPSGFDPVPERHSIHRAAVDAVDDAAVDAVDDADGHSLTGTSDHDDSCSTPSPTLKGG